MKMHDEYKLSEFQKYIHYIFNDLSILRQALTTPQLGNELNIAHYEILETLGDAVIKLILSTKLYKEFGVETPGNLTKIKQYLESNQTFRRIATKMKLWNYIYTSSNQNIKDSSIISDVFEALCGAIFIDANEDLLPVKTKIIDRFFTDWDEIIADYSYSPKNDLLELLQKRYNITPIIEYQYLSMGAQHNLQWIAKNPKILDQNRKKLLKLPKNLKSHPNKTKKQAEQELSKLIMGWLSKSEE
jgi:ribonuclease-3